MGSISSDHASSDHAFSDHESSTHTSNPTSSSHASSNQQTVEFYVSSLWSWLPRGIKRVIEHLESYDLVSSSHQKAKTPQLDATRGCLCLANANITQEQARFVWDEECDWFRIQCLEDDKGYIMSEYLKIQSELEDELREKCLIEHGGSLIPIVENDLVRKLRSKVTTPDDSSESFKSEDTDSSEGHANLRYPKGHSPVKKANNNRYPKGHGPSKTGSAEHVDMRYLEGNGPVKNPNGRGPVKKTGKRQAPQKKEYGF